MQKPRASTSTVSETVTHRHHGQPSKKDSSVLPKSLSRTSFVCSTPSTTGNSSSTVSAEVTNCAVGCSIGKSTVPVVSLQLPQSSSRSTDSNVNSSSNVSIGGASSSNASQPTFKVPAPVSNWSSVVKYSPGKWVEAVMI